MADEDKEAPSVRESLTQAFEQAESSNAATTTETTTTAPPAEGAPPAASTSVESGQAPTPEPKETPAATAPVDPGKPPTPKEVKAPEPKPVVGFKPPESWKPAVREQWKTLSPQVQAEIVRRERQVESVLKEASQYRNVAQQVDGLFNQFQDVFKGESTPPMTTMANLLNISRTLRSAPPPQRAQLMAQVISTYDVDLTLLDQALAYHVQHAPARSQASGLEQMLQKAVAPLQQQIHSLVRERGTQEQQQTTQLEQTVNEFAADPQNEYFELVRDSVADILEMGARRGQKISLQEAYDRAIMSNNEIAPLVSKQRLERAAQTANGPAAAAAARSGFSVTGAPSIPGGPPGDPTKSVRAALESAFAVHSARG